MLRVYRLWIALFLIAGTSPAFAASSLYWGFETELQNPVLMMNDGGPLQQDVADIGTPLYYSLLLARTGESSDMPRCVSRTKDCPDLLTYQTR